MLFVTGRWNALATKALVPAFFQWPAAAPFGAIEAALSICAASSPPKCLLNAAMSLRKRTCQAGAKADMR